MGGLGAMDVEDLQVEGGGMEKKDSKSNYKDGRQDWMEVDAPESGGKLSAAQKGKGKSVPAAKGGPWVEKYRPANLSDVAAHKDIIDTIDRLTGENRLPHLLLYGPPGTGKTSTILAVARKLYGPQFQNMILELNASDDRGIDVVRNQIQDFASTQSISFGAKISVKLIVLDEADAMTKDAQFSLRRIIEKYTKNTRFCLICNYVSKIIPALQSRCTRFRFAPLDQAHVVDRLRFVIKEEGVDITEGGLNAVVRLGGGDMRKVINILQSTHMASPHITEESVYLCTGNPMPKDVQQIAHWLLNDSFTTAFESHIQDFKPFTSSLWEEPTPAHLLVHNWSLSTVLVGYTPTDISNMKTNKGLALVDIVKELLPFIFQISMPQDVRIQIVDALAEIEYRLAFGTSEKLQLGALISAFTNARIVLVKVAR